MISNDWTPIRLFEPLNLETFIHEYWEHQPFLLQREFGPYFDSLLNLGDVDNILDTGQLCVNELRLARNNHILNLTEYERKDTAEIDVLAVIEHYRNGASLVFKSLNKRHPPLAKLCIRLAHMFNARVWANVYVTPAASQALEAHFDTHDVFILQIHGQKTWQIYDAAISLPMPQQLVGVQRNELPKKLFTCQLKSGDLLYLPRGYIHEASTETKPSTHITIALQTVTWAELLSNFVNLVASQEPALRRSIPHTEPNETAELEKTCYQLLQGLRQFKPAFFEAYMKCIESQIQELPSATPGSLSLENQLDTINDETVVIRRDDARYFSNIRDNMFIIKHGNREIKLPVVLAPILDFLLSGNEICLAELSQFMDKEARDNLIQVLLRERILAISGTRSE